MDTMEANHKDEEHIKTISIQVPEGIDNGDVLTFKIQGQDMEIALPDGVKPGDVLNLQVSQNIVGEKDEKREESNQESLFSFELESRIVLELSTHLPAGIEVSSQNYDTHDAANDGTFSFPWQSGIELAKMWKDIITLLQAKDSFRPRRVLELGSGLGLVGMSFAHALLRSEEDLDYKERRKIILTDLPTAIPLLEYNLQQNQHLFSKNLLDVEPLRWSLENPLDQVSGGNSSHEQPYDCIIASDVLYNEQYIPELVSTTKRLLHPTKGIFILAVRWRKPEMERDFFRGSGLEWELVDNVRCCCPLDWKIFGDPCNAQSNTYFHQTQIMKNGTPKSLGDITQEESETEFSSEEFEAWECSYIQIYIGRRRSKG